MTNYDMYGPGERLPIMLKDQKTAQQHDIVKQTQQNVIGSLINKVKQKQLADHYAAGGDVSPAVTQAPVQQDTPVPTQAPVQTTQNTPTAEDNTPAKGKILKPTDPWAKQMSDMYSYGAGLMLNPDPDVREYGAKIFNRIQNDFDRGSTYDAFDNTVKSIPDSLAAIANHTQAQMKGLILGQDNAFHNPKGVPEAAQEMSGSTAKGTADVEVPARAAEAQNSQNAALQAEIRRKNIDQGSNLPLPPTLDASGKPIANFGQASAPPPKVTTSPLDNVTPTPPNTGSTNSPTKAAAGTDQAATLGIIDPSIVDSSRKYSQDLDQAYQQSPNINGKLQDLSKAVSGITPGSPATEFSKPLNLIGGALRQLGLNLPDGWVDNAKSVGEIQKDLGLLQALGAKGLPSNAYGAMESVLTTLPNLSLSPEAFKSVLGALQGTQQSIQDAYDMKQKYVDEGHGLVNKNQPSDTPMSRWTSFYRTNPSMYNWDQGAQPLPDAGKDGHRTLSPGQMYYKNGQTFRVSPVTGKLENIPIYGYDIPKEKDAQ